MDTPRITPDHVASRIDKTSYINRDLLTICILTLVNGFTVTGESACASPDLFKEDVGRDLALADATSKIWPLEGYLLKQALFEGTIEKMAKVCHEINKAYCEALGDDSVLPWDVAPTHQKLTVTNGVMFHIENLDATASASHDNWLTEKEVTGWVYGKEKDETIKTHPCMMPFDELPVDQQAKDHLFRQTVHSLMGMQS